MSTAAGAGTNEPTSASLFLVGDASAIAPSNHGGFPSQLWLRNVADLHDGKARDRARRAARAVRHRWEQLTLPALPGVVVALCPPPPARRKLPVIGLLDRLPRAYLPGPMALEELEALPQRPRVRSQCADVPRPCPFVSCRYNLYLDVNESTGSIKLNFPGLEPSEMTQSCALDFAERGDSMLEEVGVALNITPERVRQIEANANRRMRGRFAMMPGPKLGG